VGDTVRIKVASDRGEPVPLAAFVRTLAAARSLVLQLGEALGREDEQPARGRHAVRIREACEFVVTGLAAHSAEATLELPAQRQQSLPDTDGEYADLGARAVDAMLRLAAGFANGGAEEVLSRLLPSEVPRDLVLKTLKKICPTREEGLSVEIGLDQGEPQVLTADTRVWIQRLATPTGATEQIQERQMIGRLVTLDAAEGRVFVVQYQGRNFPFPYDSELKPVLLELYEGYVLVRGEFRVRPDDHDSDELLDIVSIDTIEPLDDSPVTIGQIEDEGETVAFDPPLQVEPEFTEHHYAFIVPELCITAHGVSRHEAEANLRAALWFAWDEFALADDNDLAPDAAAIKQRLLGMVQGR
jgi:hypothetical protein